MFAGRLSTVDGRAIKDLLKSPTMSAAPRYTIPRNAHTAYAQRGKGVSWAGSVRGAVRLRGWSADTSVLKYHSDKNAQTSISIQTSQEVAGDIVENKSSPGCAKEHRVLPIVDSQSVVVVGPHGSQKAPVWRKLDRGNRTPMISLKHFDGLHVSHSPHDDLTRTRWKYATLSRYRPKLGENNSLIREKSRIAPYSAGVASSA